MTKLPKQEETMKPMTRPYLSEEILVMLQLLLMQGTMLLQMLLSLELLVMLVLVRTRLEAQVWTS